MTIVVKGWAVQWQTDSGQWRPTAARDHDLALVYWRKLECGVFATRATARDQKARCEAEWAEHVKRVPKHRISRATVTLKLEPR